MKMCTALLILPLFASVQAFFPVDIAKKVVLNPIEKMVFRNKCMEDLGCFYTGPPFFHAVIRPVSLAPFDKKDMKTNFLLFTPENVDVPQYLKPDTETISASSFNPDLETKVLIHGYLTTLKEADDYRFAMKDAFLEKGDYNVIIVDWTASNGRPYPQAVANARVVGAQLAQLINFLNKATGVEPKTFHLIGHSLGSHVSGWAGERIDKLGRITGLDPAGPYFTGTEEQVRLDKTDASFLDIIHTDNGNNIVQGLGIKEPIGDLDFYPNGGGFQPGCGTYVNVTIAGVNIAAAGTGEGITELWLSSCDHNRANELFLASILNTDCKFMAKACDNFDDYKKGQCKPGPMAEMGINARKITGLPDGTKFYLKTSDKSPFCIEENNATSTNVSG